MKFDAAYQLHEYVLIYGAQKLFLLRTNFVPTTPQPSRNNVPRRICTSALIWGLRRSLQMAQSSASLTAKLNAVSDNGSTELDIGGLDLTELPLDVCKLSGLRKLNAASNHLSALPAEFAELQALKVSFFLGNKFTSVPHILGKLSSLFMLSFKSNSLVDVPEEALASQLGWLILTENRLTRLPASLGGLGCLRKCMLASNQLTSLPDMSGCTSLELIRLSDNKLSDIPESLLRLPKLTWLALAGNPCTISITAPLPTDHRQLSIADIDIGQILGEGASGTVRKATIRSSGRTVAIKIFKSASSDGRPEDEIAASLALASTSTELNSDNASGSQRLINCMAYIDESVSEPVKCSSGPDLARGRVLALIMEYLEPSEWALLGKTPSFDSVTRDCYPAGTSFSVDAALSIALSISHALHYMHASGICHGDVYAHNILYNAGQKVAKLGDLGAAFFYRGPSSASGAAAPLPHSHLYERLDVRGYGCLLEDMVTRLSKAPEAPASSSSSDDRDADGGYSEYKQTLTRELLETLTERCLLPDVEARPSFAEIVALLSKAAAF